MTPQNTIDRIPDWFRPKSRRAMVLLVVAMLAIFFLQLLNQPIQQPVCSLINDDCVLKTNERNRMILAFGVAGLNDFEVKGKQIYVPKSDRAKYLKALADQNVLPTALTGKADEHQQFNPFMPRVQQQMIADAQKKQRVRDMIVRLPFVSDAWLEMDQTVETRAFRTAAQTAVVMVQPSNDYSLNRQQVSTIKDMIAGAIANIQSENIVVTDMSIGVAYQNLQDQKQNQIISMIGHKLERRQHYQLHIERALAEIGPMEIDVQVEIDGKAVGDKVAESEKPRQHVVSVEQIPKLPKPQPKPQKLPSFGGANGVATVGKAKDEVVAQASFVETNAGGVATHAEATTDDFVPQLLLQMPIRDDPVRDDSVHSGKQVAQLPSFQRSVKPERVADAVDTAVEIVRVNVRVPQTTIDELMETSDVSREENLHLLKAEIINRVKPLLPVASFASTFPIAIEFPSETRVPSLSPADQQIVKALKDYWPLAAVLLVSLLALGFSRRTNQAAKLSSVPTEIDPTSQNDADALRQQLTRMVDSDPESAAKVIRSWIRQAG